MKLKTKILWILAIIIIIQSMQIVYAEAGCCINKNPTTQGAYCQGSDSLPNPIGPEQCCGEGNSCPPTLYAQSTCAETSQCTDQSTLGCCCLESVGIPIRQDICQEWGYVFNATIKDDQATCSAFCKTAAASSLCSSNNWKLVVSHVKGEPKLLLSVSACNPMPEYILERCDYPCDANSPRKEFPISKSSGTIVDNVDWDKTYVYRVYVATGSGGRGDVMFTSSSVFSGNIECMGRNASIEKFCLPSEYYVRQNEFERYSIFQDPANKLSYHEMVESRLDSFKTFRNAAVSCSADNQITDPQVCSSGTCIIDKANNYQARCIETSDCQNATADNAFGMYYTENSCEYDSQKSQAKYCFYDKSETTIDYCYACQPDMSCIDYKSQGSCEKDNCHLNRCGWNTTNAEMNTGVCIDKNSGLNCEWCKSKGTSTMSNINVTNKVFDVCNADKASALSTQFGQCIYSPMDGGESKSCADIGCDYFEEPYCSKTAVTLGQYNEIEQMNSDACGIGVCNWFDTDYTCAKNSDFKSNEIDCSQSADRSSCEIDHFKPDTELIVKDRKKGCIRNMSISIYDTTRLDAYPVLIKNNENYKTYFCKGDCMSKGIGYGDQWTNRTAISINGLNFTDDNKKPILNLNDDSVNTVFYYTVDPSNNIGFKKNMTIYANEDCAYIEYTANIK